MASSKFLANEQRKTEKVPHKMFHEGVTPELLSAGDISVLPFKYLNNRPQEASSHERGGYGQLDRGLQVVAKPFEVEGLARKIREVIEN
jgi:hypothetical protein